MPRILGVDIPNDKRVAISLTYLYGVGSTAAARIVEETGIDPDKRGKDLKCFEDLQETIDKMSLVDGKIDQTIKANRTAIAVHYQHLFPNRFYSTGVA